jgi:hypothetical protein
MRRIGFARISMVMGVCLATMFSASIPAGAAGAANGVAVCTGSGALYASGSGGNFSWSLSGSGSCPAITPFTIITNAQETQNVTLSGSGSSSSLGLCSGLVVTNLVINVTVTFTGTVHGKVLVQHQVWSLPVTIYPVVTPVLISGEAVGASAMISHIFLSCTNTGIAPSLQVVWAQTVPNLN